MAREHANVKMTTEEMGRFLATQTRCVLATLEADGGPFGDAVACVFHEGSLYFRVPKDSRSFSNIQRDPRVCCVAEIQPRTGYYTYKCAMLHGRAAPVTDAAVGQHIGLALGRLPDPVEGRPNSDGAVFSLGLDDVASFDFSKIQKRFDG